MTKAMTTRTLGAALAVLVLAGSVRAEEANTPPQPYVVLVGISKYKDPQIKPRAHAEDDAKALYDLFTNKDYLGVDAKHIRLLLGSEDAKRGSKPATVENIRKALKWMATNARPKDPIIFAFIGNGGPLGELGDRRCYFAADSTFKDRNKDALAAADVGEDLKNLKSQRFTTFLDVDFTGFTGAAASTEPKLGESPYKEFLGDDESEDHAPTPGRVLYLATRGLSTSIDLKEHGLFTKVILDGLKGAADGILDKEGKEADGLVTVEELAKYLDKHLSKLAKEHGKTKDEKEQVAFALGGSLNHYALTSNPAIAPKAKERLDKLASLVKDSTVSKELGEEGKQLLERMPHLEAQRKLRKAYQDLVDGTIPFNTFENRRDTILESTRLPAVAAVGYATKVWEAIDLVKADYVKELNEGEMVGWAIKGLYRRLDEKMPAEIEDKLKNTKGQEEKDLRKLLAEVRQQLGKREDLDKHKDIDLTLQRMLANLDPYTTYIDPDTLLRFQQDITGNFTGIGIQIRKDNTTDMLLVVTPIKNSPAFEKGLQAGDIITKIIREVDSDGKPLKPAEELSTKGLLLADAVKKILGQEGTKVKLVVQREGEDKPLEFEITRGKIQVETVLGVKRDDKGDWDYTLDKDSKIGYLRLTQFSRNSTRDLYRVMSKLQKQGIKGFVLDLRFNPGGLLDSAVLITDLFIPRSRVVSIRPRVGRETALPRRMDPTVEDSQRLFGFPMSRLEKFPMVCLVNGYSASGSEIVSAALQDLGRAYIIGERSYGKGSVQNIQPFDGGEIKLTTATFWRPSGKNLNKASTGGKDNEEWGVVPDKEVKLTPKEREDLAEAQHNSEIIQPKNKKVVKEPKEPKEPFKDKQLDAALNYLHDMIKLEPRGLSKTDN